MSPKRERGDADGLGSPASTGNALALLGAFCWVELDYGIVPVDFVG